VEKTFRKDFGHLGWDEVYARQAQRAHLLDAWMDAACLGAGDHVLEVGCGPGHVSLALADRVGPGGIVYALDKSAEALAYLKGLQRERGIPNIHGICADAATVDTLKPSPDAALITMVLHHAEDPPGILGNVARLLPCGARVVVAEFHPDGPCEHRPPPSHRLAPEQVQAWCEDVGFAFERYRRQSPEHYMLVARRRT
jgi:ubiquinone/menaquinone biosynthesis C-methylase UbiE